MKKVIALLSLTAFMAVSVIAQTPQSSAPVSKKEAPVTSIKAESKAESKVESKAAMGKSCCMKANTSCCKNNKDSKNCTAEQKAACAKAGKECSAHASVAKENKAAEVKGEKVPVVKAQTLDANEIQ